MENQHRLVMIKNESKFLLSICTPTYNRAELFQKSLDILLPQIAKYRDKVSMHISDNASTDNTETMIREMSCKYNVSIDYYRQSENIGLERNYAKATSMSDGKYTYVLCDDDILAPNFLQTIIEYLDTDEEYGLIHFNWLHADSQYNCFERIIQDRIYTKDTYMTVQKFWQTVTASPDYSSAVIFNSKVWNYGVCQADEYDGGGFWGLSRIVKGSYIFNKTCIYHYFPLLIERSAGRSYQPYSPYYNFVDLCKIFRQNDTSVYELWRKALAYSPFMLEDVSLDTSFYREHRDEMKEFLTDEQLKLYDYIINNRNPKSAYKKWVLRRRMMRRIHKVWDCIINHHSYYE